MQLLGNKSYRLVYRFFAQDATVEQLMNDTAQEIVVSAVSKGGTVRDLWAAAENCFQQAKQQGDWHKFIENFEMQEDGSFEKVMGS